MKPTTKMKLGIAMLALLMVPALVAATPNPNSAVITLRIFNDCPTSIATSENDYPSLIAIQDEVLDCTGYANLHIWRFSEDGITEAEFNNDDNFSFSARLTINGTSEGEAGLAIAPWWSQDVDGRFNVRSTDGEIACFGGRLPFYSFTASHGLNYVKGTEIILGATYRANENTEADPATIEYVVNYEGNDYSSGPLPFDEGNPDEDPPYGLWGMLNDARVGGYTQVFLQAGNPDAGMRIEWADIEFVNLDLIAVEEATWSDIKASYR